LALLILAALLVLLLALLFRYPALLLLLLLPLRLFQGLLRRFALLQLFALFDLPMGFRV
jgi:hypothetical protein